MEAEVEEEESTGRRRLGVGRRGVASLCICALGERHFGVQCWESR